MTSKERIHNLEVLKAYLEGKTIQVRSKSDPSYIDSFTLFSKELYNFQ